MLRDPPYEGLIETSQVFNKVTSPEGGGEGRGGEGSSHDSSQA